MKKSKLFAGALSALVLVSVVGSAFAMGPGYNDNQHRINQGIRNGSINRQEARQLRRNQYRINRYAEHARETGGRLSFAERAKLQRMKTTQKMAIYKDKHDRY